MAILKHIASKSSNYGAALEYLIFKHDELRKAPILDQNGNRIMRDEFYLDGLNCEPYSFDAACQQLNREYQKNKNKDEIKSHHYIISFDPRDSTENCLTGKRAQELGLEYAKANFPGHQALVCTHMDGHNGSGNIHVHIVINSLRKLDVPQQPFMERPIDCKAGYKHHVTNEYLKHLQKSLMDLCQREFLHQVDLLSPSRTGVTEAEYWAQRRLDEKKREIEKEGFTPNPTKFQTQKQLIRNAVAAAREKAISYEDFQDILQDEYNIFVKTQRGRYSYLPPERNKFISERSLGESCKRECLEGFFVQNAEKNLRYKEEPILIFTTRTRLRLVVDLQDNVKAQENLAYALKVKISNLQKMAETLVWVQENNINDLTERNDLCKAAQASAQAAYERLSQAEDELYKTNEQIHYTHEAIIPAEQFELVQRILETETRRPNDAETVALFAGFLYCGDCGSRLVRRSASYKGKRYIYYQCSGSKQNKGSCTSHNLRDEKLYNIVRNALQMQIQIVMEEAEFVESIRQAQQEPYRVRRIERQIRQLIAEKAHTQGIKEKLYGDYAEEILTREDFLNYNELYSKRIEEYDRKITELEAERQNLQTAPNAYPFLDVYRKYRKLEEITRPMVVELIEKIEVYEGNRVEITFRFHDEIADLLEELHQKQMGQHEVSA